MKDRGDEYQKYEAIYGCLCMDAIINDDDQFVDDERKTYYNELLFDDNQIGLRSCMSSADTEDINHRCCRKEQKRK